MANKLRSHDWLALQIVFLESDHTTVASFLRAHGVDPTSGNARRQTAGWAKRRHQIGIKAIQGVEQELEAKIQAAHRKKVLDACQLAHMLYPMLATYLQARARNERPTKPALTPFELEAVWRAVTTDLGEPIRIVDRGQSHLPAGQISLVDVVKAAAEERRSRDAS